MKVSIIVPVYNMEFYIERCLKSLVNQTLQDIEIIVVDDGSTDKSEIIIKQMQKVYGNIIYLKKENGGQATARNMALKIAQGEYVGFVDSDDWVDIDMYENMYLLASENKYDIVICNTVDEYQGYQVFHRQSDVGKFRKCGSVCNKIFRRELIGTVKFPVGLWYEDLCFGVKMLMKTEKIGYVEEHYYHAFNREGSTMNNNDSVKNLDMLTVMKEIISYAHKEELYEKFSYDIEYMVIEHILITSINRVAVQKNSQKRMVIKKMREFVLQQYPAFKNDDAFKEFSSKEQMIAKLNAKGLYDVVRVLVFLKSKLRRKSL